MKDIQSIVHMCQSLNICNCTSWSIKKHKIERQGKAAAYALAAKAPRVVGPPRSSFFFVSKYAVNQLFQ